MKSNVALGALLNRAVPLQLICPALHVPALPLTSVPERDLLVPLIVSPPLASTTVLEAALPMVPPVQLNGPAKASDPVPVSVPLLASV